MTRNFKTLEIGKYYVSDKEPLRPILITELDYDVFRSEDGEYYHPDGRYGEYYHPNRDYAFGKEPNLTTEVTVTITPVSPRKPREFWVVYNGDKAVYAGESKEEVESKMAENISKFGMDAILPIVRMREVMDENE